MKRSRFAAAENIARHPALGTLGAVRELWQPQLSSISLSQLAHAALLSVQMPSTPMRRKCAHCAGSSHVHATTRPPRLWMAVIRASSTNSHDCQRSLASAASRRDDGFTGYPTSRIPVGMCGASEANLLTTRWSNE